MTDLLKPSTTEASFGETSFEWSLPEMERTRSEPDTAASSTVVGYFGPRRSGTGGACWKTALADLLDQALTVDVFTEAARQVFGDTCTVVPIGDGVSMQQVMPPQRIVITDMVNDMVTGACCY